jgi:hypothetical protein
VKELLGEAQILLDYLDQEQSEESDKPTVRICISYKIDGQFGVDPDLDQTLRNLAKSMMETHQVVVPVSDLETWILNLRMQRMPRFLKKKQSVLSMQSV